VFVFNNPLIKTRGGGGGGGGGGGKSTSVECMLSLPPCQVREQPEVGLQVVAPEVSEHGLEPVHRAVDPRDRAWQILLATSEDAIQLNTGRF